MQSLDPQGGPRLKACLNAYVMPPQFHCITKICFWLLEGQVILNSLRSLDFLISLKIYIEPDRTYNDKFYALGPDMTWSELSGIKMPNNRSRHCVVQLSDDKIAFIGGSNDQNTGLTGMDIFDFSTETWMAAPFG